jgi:outer membrane protein TolC
MIRGEVRLSLLSVCLIFTFFLLPGCASKDKYRYENIQKDYAARLPAPENTATTNRGQPDVDLQRPLSLTEAIKVTLVNNPDKQMANARINQSRALVERANAAFYPAFGFYTEYLQGDAPSAFLFKTVDQRMLPPNTNLNNPGWFENWETGMDARWNLYNGGRDALTRDISKSGLAISNFDRLAIENRLVIAASQTYFNCLAAKEFVAITEESVASVAEQLRVMRVKFKAGGALKSDLLSLEVRLAQAREEVVRSGNRLKTLLTALTNILGFSPEVEIQLADTDTETLQIPAGFKKGIAFALASRPDLKKIREQIVQSRMALDMAGAGYLPSVDLYGKLYFDDPHLSYDWDRKNWTAAVLLNWEFFSGFSTRAEKKKASATLEEVMAVDRKTVLNVKLEVKNAYLDLEAARTRLAVARKSVASAEESLKLVKLQYEGGSATITRYLEAELDRNRAKMRATTAFYDHEKALYEIGRAIGYWHAEN